MARATRILSSGGVVAAALAITGSAHGATLAYPSAGTYDWTVPAGITTVDVDLWGARGSGIVDGSAVAPDSRPGRTRATLTVTPGEVLRVVVGGAPPLASPAAGGFNGGGAGGLPGSGGGGGATDVRQGGTTLAHRVSVAGGGGGGSSYGSFYTPSLVGGAGGGVSGGDGVAPGSNGTAGAGATQSAGGPGGASQCALEGFPLADGQPGALGQGGAGAPAALGGGGGGGWYGGGGGGGPPVGPPCDPDVVGTLFYGGGTGGGGSGYGPAGAVLESGQVHPDGAQRDGYAKLRFGPLPTTPTGLATTPASPSATTAPVLRGNAPGGTSVEVFVGATCAGTPFATVTAATFAGAGVTLALAPGQTTAISARSVDDTLQSACSAPLSYVVWAPAPVTVAPGPPLEPPRPPVELPPPPAGLPVEPPPSPADRPSEGRRSEPDLRPRRAAVVVKQVRLGRAGSLAVAVRCSAGSRPCRGTLRLLHRGRAAGSVRYDLAPGTRSVLAPTLRRAVRHRVRRGEKVVVKVAGTAQAIAVRRSRGR